MIHELYLMISMYVKCYGISLCLYMYIHMHVSVTLSIYHLSMLNVTIPFYLIIKIHHTDLVDVTVHNCSIRQNYAFFYKDKWQCIHVNIDFLKVSYFLL